MNVENFRSRIKLLRVTSIILKFIALLKKDPNVQKSVITADDISLADHKWTQTIQSNSFSTEWQRLRNGEDKVIMKHLVLFMDRDKIIRCEGRINQSTLPISSKNPILLPAKHLFTTLIIQNRHQLVHHNGIRETLAAVRETHWILRGREAVKRVLRICVVCRKFEGKPYPAPLPPDLPEERVSEGPPFANTGIDFAGPLYVKTLSTDSEQTDRVKTYICLFTCASTRAIHLELTETLSAQSFLHAFRRFVSRRGLTSTIMSDNAKTFKSASAEVRKIQQSKTVHQQLANQQIQWEYIVEKAPWWGGYWERLVQSVKRCLRKTIGRTTLTFEELRTVTVEIEATLNNRPLTYIYDDIKGIFCCLTPPDLIYGY